MPERSRPLSLRLVRSHRAAAKSHRCVRTCGHTAGWRGSRALIRNAGAGRADAQRAGVHDVEAALFGLSLGCGWPTRQGMSRPPQYMRDLTRHTARSVRRRRERPAALAFSTMRGRPGFHSCWPGACANDGPLPETITDMNAPRRLCAELRGAAVLCLGTMLHSIATGNICQAGQNCCAWISTGGAPGQRPRHWTGGGWCNVGLSDLLAKTYERAYTE